MAGDSTYMNIQFGVLDGVFSDLEAAQANARTVLDGLVSQVIGPDGSGLAAWDGDAKAAFLAAQATWTARCEHMHSSLVAARNHVANTSELYLTTERQNTGLWH